jgi:hypothetical protein
MDTIWTDWTPSIGRYSSDDVEEITADGHTFASPEWYRLIDQLDLSTVAGGSPTLRYLVAGGQSGPFAACPLLYARGAGIYFLYSLRQYFFEHWIDEAIRINPSERDRFARILAAVGAYRRFLEWTGSKLDECLIATSPLCYRAHIAVAPSAPADRTAIASQIVAELQRESRRRRQVLWFLGVDDAEGLGSVLESAGFQRTFLFYDNRIDLENYGDFADYLQTFRRTTRRALLRDMRRTDEAGIRFEVTSDFDRHGVAMSELYQRTYSKYGDSFFRHPPAFWTALCESLGPRAEAIFAWRRDELVGFTILLKSPRRGEIWTYRIGRSSDGSLSQVPYYFCLSFYEPLKRAIELGYRRIWLGPASYEAKSVRGAAQVPLYNYFWLPRRFDRWFLMPYLKLFGRVSQQEIAGAIDRPLRPVRPARSFGFGAAQE